MNHLRAIYGIPAKRGGRIRFTPGIAFGYEPKEGTILGAKGTYLRVRFDGEKRTAFLHPTWEVTYL
jgi:hypothetical protein